MTMADLPLDADIFDTLQDTMGEGFVEDLVNTFLEEAPGLIKEMKAAMVVGDADKFRRGAHSLKSNANVFGATDLAKQARQLELGGLNSDNGPQIEALEDRYAEASTALIEWRDG